MTKLKELRQRKALSIRDLAERADISYSTLYRLEHGKTGAHPQTVRKLAEALEISPEDLSEPNPKKVEVEVGAEDSNGIYRAELVRFTGRKVDAHEISNTHLTLYECPKGYRVHIDDEGQEEHTLYPRNYAELYSAEDIAAEYPAFGDTVGVWRIREID